MLGSQWGKVVEALKEVETDRTSSLCKMPRSITPDGCLIRIIGPRPLRIVTNVAATVSRKRNF